MSAAFCPRTGVRIAADESRPTEFRLEPPPRAPKPDPGPDEEFNPRPYIGWAGLTVCGGVAAGVAVASALGLPEEDGVGVGFMIALFGPFAILITGAIREQRFLARKRRAKSHAVVEALPEGVIGKTSNGLYIYREGSL